MSYLRSLRPTPLGIYAVVILGLLVLPLVMLVPMSLNDGNTMRALPETWSLRWYEEVWFADSWRRSFFWSLAIGTIATVLATVMGYIAAETLLRISGLAKSVLEVLVLLPMMVPAVIVAFSTFLLSTWLKPDSNWWLIAIGQSLLALPVATIIIAASLRNIDCNLLRAAQSMGASRWQIFCGVKLPLALDGLIAAAALSFLIAFDELLIAVFLTRPGLETLPVRIYDSVTYELTPAVAVISVLLIVLVSTVTLVSAYLQRRMKNSRRGV